MSGTQFVQELNSPSFLPNAVLGVPLKINAQRVHVLAPGTLVVTSPEGITKSYTFVGPADIADGDQTAVPYSIFPVVLDMQVRIVESGTDLDLDTELILLA